MTSRSERQSATKGAGTMKYPIKLDAKYPCRGTDADGATVYFPDLLDEGDLVGPTIEHDGTPGEASYVDGVVVLQNGGLWAVAR
jgi:hypothetical protein